MARRRAGDRPRGRGRAHGCGGARRTGTAFARFRAESHAEDLYISAGSPKDPEVAKFDDELERLPQVERAGRVAAMMLGPLDLDIQSPYHFAGTDNRYGNTIDRPNVVSGRRPNPERADEVLVNRAMANGLHLKVGDTLDWLAFTPAQTEVAHINPADGEKVHLKVVGIGSIRTRSSRPRSTTRCSSST